MKTSLLFLFCAVGMLHVEAAEIRIKIEKQYLNLPISHQSDRKKIQFIAEGLNEEANDIRLAEGTIDYWVFRDFSALKGKYLTIRFDGNTERLSRIYQSDQIDGADSLYKETNRPQIHFTSKRGWINDPNGLLYANGEYHLYFQHNPYEREWGNMHWGHAVSRDLVHWEELPIALYPDTLGTMFSGSAVMDYHNTAGFNRDGKTALVAIYTADGTHGQTQCIAYSLDHGRTFNKYHANPVIDSGKEWDSRDTRDPKVFWHKPSRHWVMVLNERDGHSIYTSSDLKSWQYQSHIQGFWECPELFELPVDGKADNTRWVMYGASGTYMIGSFDGKQFTPEAGKFYFQKGNIYAAQTITDAPDGRRIQIGWGTVHHEGMPFKGIMTIPVELTLRTTPQGIRLFSHPVKEFDILKTNTIRHTNLTADEANKLLKTFPTNEPLYLKCTIEAHEATGIGLNINGRNLLGYDLNHNTVNGIPYSPADFTSKQINVELYIDRTTAEAFIDQGALSLTLQRDLPRENNSGLSFYGNKLTIHHLEIAPLKSIW